jgi:NADH-quinone oxidoreductase subunit A
VYTATATPRGLEVVRSLRYSHPSAIRATLSLEFGILTLQFPSLTLAFDLGAYIPVGILVVMAILFAVANLVGTHLLGPKAHGPQKDTIYESGMNPIGTARKRFNVRFYILAMTFLVFDVEIIFLYPWAVTFTKLAPHSPEARLYLARIMFFIGTSVLAYIYAWRKGVFRWD